MALAVEDAELRQAALAYVIELYEELSAQNGAPTLGTQNQAVDFILADPELRQSAAEWARRGRVDEATAAPPRRVPEDLLYRRVRDFLSQVMPPPVLVTPGRPSD